ncbi:MAG: aspartyl protease [Phycisphaerae bacterium]
MGLTTVKIKVKKTRESKTSRSVEFLVDSGAVYSVVSATVLKALRCTPYRKKDFYLADGSKVIRKIGDAYFEYKGIGGPAPVIFGEKGDKNLLGATTLEGLELVLDPFRRELRPMTMTLMGAVPFKTQANGGPTEG